MAAAVISAGLLKSHKYQVLATIGRGGNINGIRKGHVALIHQLHVQCFLGGRRGIAKHEFKTGGTIFLVNTADRLLIE